MAAILPRPESANAAVFTHWTHTEALYKDTLSLEGVEYGTRVVLLFWNLSCKFVAAVLIKFQDRYLLVDWHFDNLMLRTRVRKTFYRLLKHPSGPFQYVFAPTRSGDEMIRIALKFNKLLGIVFSERSWNSIFKSSGFENLREVVYDTGTSPGLRCYQLAMCLSPSNVGGTACTRQHTKLPVSE